MDEKDDKTVVQKEPPQPTPEEKLRRLINPRHGEDNPCNHPDMLAVLQPK